VQLQPKFDILPEAGSAYEWRGHYASHGNLDGSTSAAHVFLTSEFEGSSSRIFQPIIKVFSRGEGERCFELAMGGYAMGTAIRGHGLIASRAKDNLS
jgi:hypothetical protein